MARKSGSTTTVSHGKLHKREHSSSTLGSPATTSYATDISWQNLKSYDGVWDEKAGMEHSSHKGIRIKPYLRKLSLKDNEGLDLSRPAAENEGLTGLGINEYSMGPRSVSDVTFASPVRNKHHRSTSNNSQVSSSSGARPSMPYVHPMRQTPRPYTPPVTKSYANSSIGGDDGTEAVDIVPTEELRFRQPNMEAGRRSGSMSSGTAAPFQLTTSHSFTKLATPSQSSLSIASPVGTRPRGDTLRSMESTTTSPSSRPSLEKFGLLRGRDSPIDPATRAQEIRMARLAYKEKEEAKDRKIEQEAMRRAERDARKIERREERLKRQEESGKRSMSVSNEKLDSSIVVGRQYNDYRPAHERSMPARVDTHLSNKRTHTTPDVSKTKQARSRWLAFITWFRTRLLRMGGKVGAK